MTTTEVGRGSLSAAEVHALLRCRPGGPAELSRRLLDLPWGAEDDTSVGWAGLAARGLASPQGRPTGFASAIGLVLTAPGRWTALRVDQTSGRRALLVLEGALGTLLVVPRPPGVLDLVPLPGDPAGPASVVPTARAVLADPATRLIEVTLASSYVSSTHDDPAPDNPAHDGDAAPLVVRVVREDPGTFVLRTSTMAAAPVAADLDGVLDRLGELIPTEEEWR